MGAVSLSGELNSPMLSHYRLSERQAILVHKYFLGIEQGQDPGLGCAIASWESKYALLWRSQHQMADCRAQLEEIERYRQRISQDRGLAVNWEDAAQDWVLNHAAEWRRRHEEQLLEEQGLG